MMKLGGVKYTEGARPVRVRIVDEYDLSVKREYDQIPGGNGG